MLGHVNGPGGSVAVKGNRPGVGCLPFRQREIDLGIEFEQGACLWGLGQNALNRFEKNITITPIIIVIIK